MMRKRWWWSAVMLLLSAAAVAMPGNGAMADTTCSTWNGSQPANLGNASALYGIAVVSGCDIWAVGGWGIGPASATLVEHWTGGSWAVVPSPSPGYAGFSQVSAVSATDIWAVGSTSDGNPDSVPQPLTEHWDGTSWSVVPSPRFAEGATLSSVAAQSASDVWAVGVISHNPTARSVMLHWDGTAWTQVSVPEPSTACDCGNSLLAVSAVSATDAWAAGTNGGTYILHWDGTAWTQAPAAVPAPGDGFLQAVSAFSANDAWAVGTPEFSSGSGFKNLIMHWDGANWTQVSSAAIPQGVDLTGVAVGAPNDVWAVGATGFFPANHPVVLHWDGNSWTTVALSTPDQGAGDLPQGVAASAGGRAWVVGLNIPATGTQTLAAPVSVPAPPPVVIMPNVLGSDQQAAQNVITGAGLTVGTISADNHCRDVAGTVLVQDPAGGAQVAPGTAVSLTVSSGHTPTGGKCTFS